MDHALGDSANFSGAKLAGGGLADAQVQWADFTNANLAGVKLAGANLSESNLSGADLTETFMDAATVLSQIKVNTATRLADVVWNGTPLTRVDWSQIPVLGDEQWAKSPIDKYGKKKDKATRLAELEAAVRGYRQLTVALRNQGLNEQADRYAYRAQWLQRDVFRRERKIGQWIFSGFEDGLIGYGYRTGRILLVYLVVVLGFAAAYFTLGQAVGPHLTPLGSMIFSVTSFHGRGFFPGGISPDDPITVLAALEAIIGLLIEATFIAGFTQRLFGR
jgi:hypothetical protein